MPQILIRIFGENSKLLLTIEKKRRFEPRDFYNSYKQIRHKSINNKGASFFMISTLVLALQYTPSTIDWNPSVALVMIMSNLFAIAIGRYAIQNSGKGPDLPVPKPEGTTLV